MNDKKPLLSICIPTYNRADILDETLRSLFSDPDFDLAEVEVVVCDNASTDHTPQVAAKYPAVRYYRNEENVRDANFSRVLLYGQGEYLKLMNDTVRMIPGGLKFLLTSIETNLSSGAALFFYEKRHGGVIADCRTLGEFIDATSYRATWIGAFGLWRRDLPVVADLGVVETQLLQVDWSYRIADAGPVRIYFAHYCMPVALPANKGGGYNLFRVFIDNYLSFSKKYILQGRLSRWQYEKNKFTLFRGYIASRVMWLLFRSEKVVYFDNRGAWGIILRNYGYHPYFYLGIVWRSLGFALKGFK